MTSNASVKVEYITSDVYDDAPPTALDPFRHHALTNSHNHHDLHPWGPEIAPGTKQFDARYADAHIDYLYQFWYRPELFPYMATELLDIAPISRELMANLDIVVKTLLQSGLDEALKSDEGKVVLKSLQEILDHLPLSSDDEIFVRLGAASPADSYSVNEPTTQPGPFKMDADLILRRLLTSGRTVGRLLALSDKISDNDISDAFIVQRWSPDIEPAREVRVFCYEGRVTAVSQDVWWKKMGWRQRYSEGFVPAITELWDNVKPTLDFDTCAMDVLMTPPSDDQRGWVAQIIEFNAFGCHLNTGSDLFHWVNDYDILHGLRPGITVRFVDDWEKIDSGQEDKERESKRSSLLGTAGSALLDTAKSVGLVHDKDSQKPDWKLLESRMQHTFSDSAKATGRLEMERHTKLPLNGRWCGED